MTTTPESEAVEIEERDRKARQWAATNSASASCWGHYHGSCDTSGCECICHALRSQLETKNAELEELRVVAEDVRRLMRERDEARAQLAAKDELLGAALELHELVSETLETTINDYRQRIEELQAQLTAALQKQSPEELERLAEAIGPVLCADRHKPRDCRATKYVLRRILSHFSTDVPAKDKV